MKIPTSPAEFAELYPEAPTNWVHVTGTERFDYPIDYEVAVLHVDEAAGRIDLLSRWKPDSYCHFHRHLGETSLLVLEGEQHVVDADDTETVHKTRRPGFFATNPGGDVHMEYGGPEGTLVYFCCKAVDGAVFDVLDQNRRVLRTATIEDFVSGDILG